MFVCCWFVFRRGSHFKNKSQIFRVVSSRLKAWAGPPSLTGKQGTGFVFISVLCLVCVFTVEVWS